MSGRYMGQKKLFFCCHPVRSLIVLALSALYCLTVSGQTTDTLTIVTYYPAPFGSYKQLYAEFINVRNTGAPIYPVTLTVTYPDGTSGIMQDWQTAIGFDPGNMALVMPNDGSGQGGLLFGMNSFTRQFLWEDTIEGEVTMMLDHEGNLIVANSIGIGVTPVNTKFEINDGGASVAFVPTVDNYGHDVAGSPYPSASGVDTCDGNTLGASSCPVDYSGTCRDVMGIGESGGVSYFVDRDITCYKETRITPIYVDGVE